MHNVEAGSEGRASVSRRDLIFGVLLLSAAGVTFARLPRETVIGMPRGTVEDAIPTIFGDWKESQQGDIVLPPEDERLAAATYDDQFFRTYVNANGDQIMLLIAYARTQSSMLMVHRPESCYPGSGFEISANDAVLIPLASEINIPGRFLSANKASRSEQVLYWTRFGNEFASDWDKQRQSIALQSLRGLVPDGALIRASIISSDADQSKALLEGFVAKLYEASNREARGLLAGNFNSRSRMV